MGDLLWHSLDYIPVVGAAKNTAEAIVAAAEGDYRRAISKGAEAAIGGTLDYVSLGAGRTIMTAVAKQSGKAIAKEVGKIAVKEGAAVATATAVRMYRNKSKRYSPGPFRSRSKTSKTDKSGKVQSRSEDNRSHQRHISPCSSEDEKMKSRSKANRSRQRHISSCSSEDEKSINSSELETATSASEEESEASSSEEDSSCSQSRRRSTRIRYRSRQKKHSSGKFRRRNRFLCSSEDEECKSSSELETATSASEEESEESSSEEDSLCSQSRRRSTRIRYRSRQKRHSPGKFRRRNKFLCSSGDEETKSSGEVESTECTYDEESDKSEENKVESSSEDGSRFTQGRKGKSQCNPSKTNKRTASGSKSGNGSTNKKHGGKTVQTSSSQSGQVASSGQERRPNQNNNGKRAPKRGHHIINNDILKFFKTIIEKFLNEKFRRHDINTGSMHLPVPQEVLDLIENELVVSPIRYLEDPNDRRYGEYREMLEDAILDYMRALYNENSGRYDEEHIQEQILNARKKVISLVETVIEEEIFIDQTTYKYWMLEDVNICFPTEDSRRREREKRRKKFKKAKAWVEGMLRGLVDIVNELVREIIEATEDS